MTDLLLRAAIVVGALVGVAAVLVGLLWAFQRHLIYLPDPDEPPPAAEVLEDARDVTLSTSDGLRLGAWYVPAGRDGRSLTVLVAPGNAGNRADRAPLARVLSNAGFDVLLLDYRGYGGNPGRPSEEGLRRDARAAYRFLVDEMGTPPKRLLYFGESLGAAVVAELAAEHPPTGMLLRSPFTDLASVGQRHYPIVPVRLLLRDRFPVTEYVARVRVPTTVVYGTADTVIPPEQSRRVADAAAGETKRVEIAGAGHNDPEMFVGSELLAAVDTLARRVAPEEPRA